MRFIGSKIQLIGKIEKFIEENIELKSNMIFCDLFSGSVSVARYFKPKYQIISNDIMNFSYILQQATIGINEIPEFKSLKNYLKLDTIDEIFSYLENVNIEKLQKEFMISKNQLFIYQNYTPNELCERMYLTSENGRRIDVIRIILDKWLENKIISQEEFLYLLACLIEGVPFVSNISGVYGAYLKKWDSRALKSFKFEKLEVKDNFKNNKCYNKNAHDLILEIEGDILYLDPPYNNRQYLPNYHVLETISKYDYPIISGKTGLRDYKDQISKFCRKKEAREALEQIIKEAKFEHIIMSYSTDGILSIEEIEEILKKYGLEDSYIMADPIEYRKYKSKNEVKVTELHELLFYIRKVKNNNSTVNNNNNEELLKCPFNYIGGKHKLLPQLMKYFPEKITKFIDLFGGGFNVGININANEIIYNDQITPLVELYRYFQSNSIDHIIEYIERTILMYNLSKENKESFNKFRDYYNKSIEKNPLNFYILICFSFNYQIRFNNSGLFNCPHGTNRSSFSPNLKNRLIKFIEKIQSKNIIFENEDFLKIYNNTFDSNTFYYCDPPYLITTGSYNDGNRGFKDWRQKEEEELLDFLCYLNKNNIKFALSNVIEHDGKINYILKEWIDKNNFKIIDISSDYSNSNYQKNKESKSREVLIINY